jgi:hypothetical protein
MPQRTNRRKSIAKQAAHSLPSFTKADLARATRKLRPQPDPLGKPVGNEVF